MQKIYSKKINHFILALTITCSQGLMFGQNQGQEEYFEIAKNISIFNDVYKNINTYFVDETQPGQLMKTGIDAMLRSLDPYTNYIPESNIEDYRMMQTGQYGGIGALIKQQGDYIVISEPYDNFPAAKADIKAGDKILEIDGKSIKGKSSSEVSELLKGTAGTELKLKIERPKTTTPIEKTIEREVVKIPSVPHYQMLDDKTGYIKLTSFTQTASKEVGDAFKTLRDSNTLSQLILDLRGNGGGLLNEAVKIVNFFVKRGVKVVETKGRFKENNYVYKTTAKPMDTEIPLIVLIDGNSASASEIVSGSLQDLDRAIIVGQQSFGKGLVQQVKDLDYNTKLKVTIAKYYTSSGRCIQRLDYSDRKKTGKGTSISDSLISYFKTKNGRKVRDGRGIDPDIEIPEETFSTLTQKLVIKDVIFNYATDYYYSHDNIAPPQDFSLTTSEYDAFKTYAKSFDFEYDTYSYKAAERLKETTEKEGFDENTSEELDALLKKLAPNKDRDLEKFKDEIQLLLINEIVSRYYLQKGRTKASLSHDEFIIKAIETLNDKEQYAKILKP